MLLKKTKKIMSIVLSMLFMVCILPAIPAFADYEGSCGEGATYLFDRATSTLTISGNGEMSNYGFWKKTPWNSYKNSIKNLTIENAVTSIGDWAFSDCSDLTGQLTIPDNVTYIGNGAFYGCRSLTGQLTIPDSVTYIGKFTFSDCSGLEAINVDESNTEYK